MFAHNTPSAFRFEYSIAIPGDGDYVARLFIPHPDVIPADTWKLFRDARRRGAGFEIYFADEASAHAMRATVLDRLS